MVCVWVDDSDCFLPTLFSPSGQIDELQQAAAANNKSELEALLDAVRQEKNRVDERAARLQETVSRAQCEKTTLEEQVATLQQENKVKGVWGLVEEEGVWCGMAAWTLEWWGLDVPAHHS